MVRMAIAGPVGTIRIHPAIEARARLVAPFKLAANNSDESSL
jgi:hypothetical protein